MVSLLSFCALPSRCEEGNFMEEIGYKEFIKSKPTSIKPMQTNHMYCDVVFPPLTFKHRECTSEEIEKHRSWTEKTQNSIQNWLFTQHEYISLNKKNLCSRVELEFSASDNISSLHFRNHKQNKDLDDLVEKCLLSMNKEKKLKAPYQFQLNEPFLLLEFKCPTSERRLPQPQGAK